MNLLIFQMVVIAVLLLFSALLSASEIAYTGLTHSQLKRVNRLQPDALATWEKTPNLVLATLLLSNNGVNIAVGVISANMALQISSALNWDSSYLTLALGFISGSALLVFGEIFPKVWGRQYSVSWALRISPLMNTLVWMIKPFARAAMATTNFILRRIGMKKPPSLFLSHREIEDILRHASIPTHSKRILQNLIEFSESTAQHVMRSRSDIVAIPIEQSIDKIIRTVLASGYSRLPVYEGPLDNVVGLLYAKDLLVAWRSGDLIIIHDILRPLHFVEPTLPLSELLRVFRSGRHHMAVVRKQEPNTPVLGIVTLQDALEGIVGEIREEI